MKKIILLLLLTINCYSQDFKFFKINGELIKEGGTINQMIIENFKDNFFYSPSEMKTTDNIYLAYYYRFTAKPAFILALTQPTVNEINEVVNSINLKKYYNSSYFEHELKSTIKKNEFKEDYLIKYFPKADNINTTSDGTNTLKFYFYNDLNIVFVVENGYVVRYNLTK